MRGMLDELFGLEGKVAVVTGGSGAIGRVFVAALLEAGASVAVLGRNLDACQHVCAECDRDGSRSIAIAADVLDKGQLEAARSRIVQRWNRIDILVNAAGGNVPSATLAEGSRFSSSMRTDFDRCSISISWEPCCPLRCLGQRWSMETSGMGRSSRSRRWRRSGR